MRSASSTAYVSLADRTVRVVNFLLARLCVSQIWNRLITLRYSSNTRTEDNRQIEYRSYREALLSWRREVQKQDAWIGERCLLTDCRWSSFLFIGTIQSDAACSVSKAADPVFAMSPRLVLITCVYVICPLMTSSIIPNLDSFDELVRQLMDNRRVPGLVVSVVDLRRPPSNDGGPRDNDGGPSDSGGGPDDHACGPRDPVVVLRQYGWADVDAQRAMKADSRVCIASLTKAFTSTLLGILLYNTNRQVLA